MSEFKPLDPTACGIFLVAALSISLGFANLTDSDEYIVPLFRLFGILLAVIALLAYRAESNFGFTVFLLVAAAVFATGAGILGGWGNIGFAIIFLLTVIWSLIAKTPKLLTGILCTTTIIFLLVGINTVANIEGTTFLGIVALVQAVLSLYLGFGLATEGKVKVF